MNLTTGARYRLRCATAGTVLGLLAALASAISQGHAPSATHCYEDEVIVWTGDEHGACVALDHLWYDTTTGTVHWYQEDERRG